MRSNLSVLFYLYKVPEIINVKIKFIKLEYALFKSDLISNEELLVK